MIISKKRVACILIVSLCNWSTTLAYDDLPSDSKMSVEIIENSFSNDIGKNNVVNDIKKDKIDSLKIDDSSSDPAINKEINVDNTENNLSTQLEIDHLPVDPAVNKEIVNSSLSSSQGKKNNVNDNDKENNKNQGAKGTLSLSSDDKKMYHVGLSKNDIEGAQYVILPGDPGRVPKIAEFLENSKKIGQNREYTSYLGTCNGEKVLVMSTGMGGPSTAIGVEELSMLGIKNFIRVGTSGGMQLNVNAGDLVVATGAVRQEGTSKEYAPIEFPAIPDFNLTRTLCDAADKLAHANNIKVHVGPVHCKDSFYGQHSPERMPVSAELTEKWKAWIDLGVKCSEMETASLFVLGSYLKVRTAAILLVVWNQEQEKLGQSQNTNFDTDSAIKAVVTAISDSIQKDKNKS